MKSPILNTQVDLKETPGLDFISGALTHNLPLYAPRCFIDTFRVPRRLHTEAKRSLTETNAGGKSEISEAYSIHHLGTLLKAKECVMEIKYWKSKDFRFGLR